MTKPTTCLEALERRSYGVASVSRGHLIICSDVVRPIQRVDQARPELWSFRPSARNGEPFTKQALKDLRHAIPGFGAIASMKDVRARRVRLAE